jgi:hypothetical protein
MSGHSLGGSRAFFLMVSVLIALWSSVASAAPVVGPLRVDQITVANRILNAIGGGATSGGSSAEVGDMVVELLNAARPQIVAAFQEANIAGEVEVQAGTFLSGFVPVGPGVNGSKHIILSIYQNGNRLGDLTVGKSYQGSSVTPYARFTKIP